MLPHLPVRIEGRDRALAVPVTVTRPVVLSCGMPKTSRPDSPPLFTPSTLPQPAEPDPVIAFIEDALIAIANRRDEAKVPSPPA
jgi:hypothetical protein